MDRKQFILWNRICASGAFLISAITYLLTLEPTASFWDCGEFIASSYRLEVGHPPGNPMFQLIARFFTMFGDGAHAAVLVNAMSGICSALTIFFLYLTIVWLVKRLIPAAADGSYTKAQAIAIFASALVGALAYCFSDTFWFSAVEGEVYAMSSLFTAVVFWAMTMWYDRADEPHSSKWIVLIAFLMGLSIGVHLLNLLAIPALVFMYYFRKKPSYSFTQHLGIFIIGVVILALILFVIVPLVPKFAAYTDLFFVNVLHLPYNAGAAFFIIAVIALCFWGAYRTMEKGKVFWNTALLCLTTILVGFSVFSLDIIRSCAKTPTNEYQPDNAFTLVRYLSREQYGKTPILYGQYFDAPYDMKSSKYWAPLPDEKGRDRYRKVDGPVDAAYRQSGKMLFPRMWSSSPDGRYEDFYNGYTRGKGTKVAGAQYRKPTAGANLAYFFDYQLNWMYWRYFMWNFVGRQNDIHSPSPGNIFHGNWESGVGFLDRARLTDQRDAPALLQQNKGKNHYFFLPLILGLIGLCFQFGKDKRGSFLTFLMFFMTGIAIVIYLNQPPYQVRERDYAYAGSFYFFSVWIGLGLAGLTSWLETKLPKADKCAVAIGASLLCLGVPALMAAENWDDHDRSGRRTAAEIGFNYLNSVGNDGILVTHGDNDTFPLWYAQEVEGVRTDVRICNTSLLGTDWHIDQMRYAVNESAPLPISIPHTQYLYGTNEYVPIVEKAPQMSISEVIAIFRNPKEKVSLASGRRVDYIPTRRILVPVDRRNVLESGIVSPEFADLIPDNMVINLPQDKDYLSKPELFMLDLFCGYDWTRPIHMLNMGGDLNIGLREHLEYNGFSYKIVPYVNQPKTLSPGIIDTDKLYGMVKNDFRFDALAADKYFIDYQNMYSFLGVMNIRQLFMTCANAFLMNGERERALEMVDNAARVMRRYPLDGIPVGFSGADYMTIEMVQAYYKLGEKQKALDLGTRLADEILKSVIFYYNHYSVGKDSFETAVQYAYFLADEMKAGGDTDVARSITDTLDSLFGKE